MRSVIGSDITNLEYHSTAFRHIGTNDDLVPASASTSVINAIGSIDKKLIEFPTDMLGLCISQAAHEKLWPEVGK